MAFYDLPKEERKAVVEQMHQDLLTAFRNSDIAACLPSYSSADTYIRRSAYLCTGRIYIAENTLRATIIDCLQNLLQNKDPLVRQTTINAAGEIGKLYFEEVESFFSTGLLDAHHQVRNAVIGSVKKMGEVNPGPVLTWARQYLHHPDKEIRREICHGIELRGRKHPQDILPLLQQLENDTTARVRNTLVHVVGQIAYKKDCLPVVIAHLKSWNNKKLVADCLLEIIDVHHRYRDFAHLSQEAARNYVAAHFSLPG